MTEKTYNLQIVEVNHTDNAFYTLGGAGWTTEAGRAANLASIPPFEHDCDAADRCYILDILDPTDGWSIVDDREISAETARTLLGVESFDELREAEKAMLDELVSASRAPVQENRRTEP